MDTPIAHLRSWDSCQNQTLQQLWDSRVNRPDSHNTVVRQSTKRTIIPRKAASVTLLAAVLLSGTAGLAQEAAPADTIEPKWDVIRKAALNPLDRQTVSKWMANQINQMATSSDPTAIGVDFYKKITTHSREGVPAFKEALAQIMTEAFTARYQQGSEGNRIQPMASVFVLMSLRETGPPAAALPAFRAVLTDPAPAVRCQGMIGLNALRSSVTGANRQALAQDIQKAAANETYPVVLGRIYEFFQFAGDNPSPPLDLQASSRILRELLDARLSRLEKQGGWPVPADAEAVVWLLSKAQTAPLNSAANQTHIARLAGRLLADAGHAWAELKPPQHIKRELERIVLMVEPPLGNLCKAKAPNAALPSPSLSDTVLSTAGPQARVSEIIAKWIGSGQTKGVLNEAFNLPVGLGIQRPASTTTTPAS
ncbi:MAG TPA: hypothetical protein PKG54_00880 [Phycisphaerae bacterium]|jgi:hypothetical protein|nr:hypothetical protein [Phycisphaerae bacterium]HOB73053.1 hypothetical protein [Phycisphaerae bacterium]HOJ54066.1 hypothetical protein [Phycisphaerae bacterium]HOL26477.1 hypothetical protein [Phycisphaerae bacterium]HPP20456.1 hypothetical protein [Phycisphaerae bacterium]